MRIIAGKYRGRNLKSPPSLEVRPTSDRLRETLFNVLAPRIQDTHFLDLCAGSGAIGIEALSRGAGHVTFVDRSRKMCGLVEANLDLVRAPEDETEVIQSEATEFLRLVTKDAGKRKFNVVGSWDIIFFDPPYAMEYLAELELFGSDNAALLNVGGLLVVEHHHKNSLPEEAGNLRRTRILKQGDSALSFYSLQ